MTENSDERNEYVDSLLRKLHRLRELHQAEPPTDNAAQPEGEPNVFNDKA